MCSFYAKFTSRGYHFYKETSWSKARDGEKVKVELETNKSSKKDDSYASAIRWKNEYFNRWKTVEHIPRDIYRHVYYPIKTGGGSFNGTVICRKCLPSPIPPSELEIPLLLKFSYYKLITFEKMKNFFKRYIITTLMDRLSRKILLVPNRWGGRKNS